MSGPEIDPMLIESAMPAYDVVLAEQTVVCTDPATVFDAVGRLDFLTVSTPLLRASMWIRGLPQRICGRPAPPLLRFTLSDDMPPGWLLIGQMPAREIAFGAVGKFWQPNIEWRDVTPTEFREFVEPGWAKIAANFSVAPCGEGTLLRYECRTSTTDAASRRRFLRYWRVIRPFVGHIMRATLATIKSDAESVPRARRGIGDLTGRDGAVSDFGTTPPSR